MIVVNGKPEVFTKAITKSKYFWNKCVEKCGNDDKCVLADDNNEECQWFEYDGITKVKQTQSVEGKKVAFKILNLVASAFHVELKKQSVVHDTAKHYFHFINTLNNWALQLQKDNSVGTQTFLMRVDRMRKSSCQATPTTKDCMKKSCSSTTSLPAYAHLCGRKAWIWNK
ncbi:hypothetical protein CAEBREN_09308 [Caenorhabditis brenneri]|uniref:PAN-3 domain-containing protein n=1 Tax=Caenorhabditis brenneri TaxID=135651 RepID=G0NQ86_CAEBE|nr:hypothetical protein CAEBREN_09308 [Caenorhabditis brenneri]